MVRIKTSKGWKTIKPGQTIRGVTNVTKNKKKTMGEVARDRGAKSNSKSSGSSRSSSSTTVSPRVSSINKQQLIKSELAKKSQLDTWFILKSLLNRAKKKKMEIEIETVGRRVISYAQVGPPEQPDEVITILPPLRSARPNGGGGGGNITPVVPVVPVVPIIPKRIINVRRGPLSVSKVSVLPIVSRVVKLGLDKSKARVRKLPSRINGYFIVVKKKSKYVRVRSPLLSFNDAKDFLAYKLDNEISRSGKIVNRGKTNVIAVLPKKMKGYYVRNGKKFRLFLMKNGEKKMMHNMLVEKRKYMNDTRGERKQLKTRRKVKRTKKKKRK